MNDVTELMRRATDDLDIDGQAVLRRSIDAGVRRHRRRTAGICLAAASVLALTGATTLALRHTGTPGGSDTAVAGNPATPTVQSSKPNAHKPATPQDALTTLEAVLPAGLQATAPQHWKNGPSWHGASVVVDDGHGAGLLTAEVGWSVSQRCQPDTADTRCQALPDGSLLVTLHRPVYADKPHQVIFNDVRLVRRDGLSITLTSYNARAEKDQPKTRPQPPLSLSQLTTMARSKLWKAPAPYTPPTDPPKVN